MKDYLRNLFAARGAAFWLNLLGLSLAFVIFYVLMAEVMWHVTFDRFHKDADRVCQVFYEEKMDDFSGIRESDVFNGQMVHDIFSALRSVETVESAVACFYFQVGGPCELYPTDTITDMEGVKSEFVLTTDGLMDVFTFEWEEGNSALFNDPTYAFLPLSLAKKLFGEGGGYVGRRFGVKGSWSVVVGGVYRDFPTNSSMRNVCYQIANPAQMQLVLANQGVEHPVYLKLKKGADTNNLSDILLFARPDFKERLTKFIFRPIHEVYYLPTEAWRYWGVRGGNRTMPWVLGIVAVLVVFIAMANYVNFSMSMIPYQIKEINVRRILGELTRTIRIRLLMQASLVVICSMMVALVVIHLVSQLGILDGLMKCYLDFSHNGFVLSIMLGLVLLIPLLVGLYPAWYATSRKPALVINGSFALSPKGSAMRRTLIGGQFCISLIILMMLLLTIRQYRYMVESPVGYARDSILYVNINDASFKGKNNEYHEMLMAELKSHPNVKSVSWTNFRLGENSIARWSKRLNGKLLTFNVADVHTDYLSTVGIQLMSGRNFRPEDDRTGVLIFNEAACREFGIDTGTCFDDGSEVIGIMRDIKNKTFHHKITPMAFWVRGKWGDNCAIRMHNPKSCAALCNSIKNKLGVENVTFYTNEDIAKLSYVDEGKQMDLLLLLSLVSLLIPLIGVFGLVLFETRAKRKEIGIRKVFGATTKGILVMFNAQYLRILAVCFVIAAPVALHLYNKWIESFAYRTPMHWWLFGVAFLLVAAIVCLTVTVQSWRAAKEKPVDTIMK